MFSKLVNWQQVPSQAQVTRVWSRACLPGAGAEEDGFMGGEEGTADTRATNCDLVSSWGDICDLWPGETYVTWGWGANTDLALCHPVQGQWPDLTRLYQTPGTKYRMRRSWKQEAGDIVPGSQSLLRSSSCPHPPGIQDRVPLRSLSVRTEIASNPVPMISCHSVWSEAVRENQWECGNSAPGPITCRKEKWLSGFSSTPHSEFRLRLRNKWIEWVRQCIISKTSSIKYRQTQDLFLSIAIVTSGRVCVNWFSIDLSPSPHDWIWPDHWPFRLWLALMGPIFQVWFWPDMAWVTMLRDSNNHQY